eukprot:scaffold2353_cov167-Amphora_coffeaeformis.AAC.30
MDNGLKPDEESASFLNRPSGFKLQPLELEGHKDYMLPADGRAPGMRHRKSVADNGSNNAGSSASFIDGFVQGVLRQNLGGQFTFRNMFILCVIAGLLFVALIVLNDSTEGDFDGVKTAAPHTNSFGGKNNPGLEQHGTSGNFQRPPMIMDEDLPESNVGQAVQSISNLNVENYIGHYYHDPVHAYSASNLYAANVESTEVRHQMQSDFDTRMTNYKDRYGQWQDPPFQGKVAQTFYHNYWYKDVPVDEFPANAWQKNPAYVKEFVGQAVSLVDRVKEAIYEEYGLGLLDIDKNDTATVSKIKTERETYLSVIQGDFSVQNGAAMVDGKPFRGAAYVNERGWEGLIRKLLHAIMTEDDFFVVVAGPKAATYDGINLQFTQVMQFHEVMEPVFDRLGVKLYSRNMGMDASTTVAALGGADIYGETDIFWYIPDPSQAESDAQIDFLLKQMILSGERMPLILTPNPVKLNDETKKTAWIGNIQPGPMSCKETDVKNNDVILPEVKACEFAACTESARNNGKCHDDRTLPCWVDRQMTTQESDEELNQLDGVPTSTTSRNYRQHQLEGRKLTLLVLEALTEALKRMQVSTETENPKIFPTGYWHVGPVYEELRESVRRVKKIGDVPACEKLLENLDSEICHLEMHAFTEWTPRVTPKKNGLSSTAVESISLPGGYVNEKADAVQLYEWFDLRPLDFVPGDDEIDVHMVAILGQVQSSRLLKIVQDVSDTENHRRRLSRILVNDTASENSNGRWTLHDTPLGFCDGSAMSWCNKVLGNRCLMENVNHYKGGMRSRGTTDWLLLDIGFIKEGVILLRFEWNDAMKLPDDLIFHYSTNGPMGNATAVPGTVLAEKSVALAKDLTVFPLMINKKYSHDKSLFGLVNLALRFETSQADFHMLLTHIYYA